MPDELLYFCDETSFHEGHMAVAGLAVRQRDVVSISRQIVEIKEQSGYTGEVKWERTKARRDNVHRTFVDFLFDRIEAKHLHFHIRFCPIGEYDHRLSGPGRKADTVGKMHYQLILHRAVANYGRAFDLRIHPDNGNCTARLPEMLVSLNRAGVTRFGLDRGCIRQIICRNSETEPMLQLLDVTMGALTAYRNGRHLLDQTSEAKRNLAIHAFGRTALPNLDGNCGVDKMRFNVWNVIPSFPRGRGPRG